MTFQVELPGQHTTLAISNQKATFNLPCKSATTARHRTFEETVTGSPPA